MKKLPSPALVVLVLVASLLAATVAASWPHDVAAAQPSTAAAR